MTTATTDEYIPSLQNDAIIRVSRLDAEYPIDEPISYVVGFTAVCKRNNKSKYLDTLVGYEEIDQNADDDAVVAMAWDKLKDQFQTWLDAVYKRSSVIGSIFTP